MGPHAQARTRSFSLDCSLVWSTRTFLGGHSQRSARIGNIRETREREQGHASHQATEVNEIWSESEEAETEIAFGARTNVSERMRKPNNTDTRTSINWKRESSATMAPKSAAHKLYLICQILFISLVANDAALALGDSGASYLMPDSVQPQPPTPAPSQPQAQHRYHHHQQQQQPPPPPPPPPRQQLISKKGAQAWQNQNLSKFQKYLSEHQQELVRKNPGSLWAVARAIKMAIKECQYQMRHEPWDCPIHGFSVRPSETFGMLMSRSFKQTSFIQSLLSAAIAHSVARACTESVITTCSRKQLPHGNGFGEDIEFGRQFARDFMDVTHELQLQQQQLASENFQKAAISANSIMTPPLGSNVASLGGEPHHQLRVTSGAGSALYSDKQQQEPIWKEKRLRQMINVHNDEVGRLVSRGERVCAQKGLPSGAPTD